jgi:toxin ParE1/3/4
MAVIWSERAIADIQRIFDQIAKDSPQNALLVDDRINDQVLELGRFPGLGRKGRRKGTRELVIAKTPYIAVYGEADGGVEVITVLSGRQRLPRKF